MGGNGLELSSALFKLLALFLIYHVKYAKSQERFCKLYSNESNTTSLEFTTKVNVVDSVIIEHYKNLSCCARGYKMIKWFKDDILISDKNEYGTLKQLTEDDQILYSYRVNEKDNGTYTCKVSDGINEIQRKIQLYVLRQKYTGKAVRTNVSDSPQYAQIGEKNKTLVCEGFIGYVNNAVGQVTWSLGEGRGFPDTDDQRRYTKPYERDEGRIIGEYLNFKPVTEEDFMTYYCSISNGHTPEVFNVTLIEGVNPTVKVDTSYTVTIITAVLVCSIVLLAVVYSIWHLEIRLFWKDRFGKLENDDKEYDIFVCYDPADAEFALGVLVHTLEKVYHYRCFVYERDSAAGDWMPEIYTMKIRSSRRFLMVLSPALAVNSWCTYALYVAIEAMLNLHSKIICVVLQDILWKNLRTANGTSDHTLQQVLKVVKKVYWESPVAERLNSVLKMCTFQRYKPCTSSMSESNCGNSEEPLTHVLSGSMDNVINSIKFNNTGVYLGSSRFWTSLRMNLPSKRSIDMMTVS